MNLRPALSAAFRGSLIALLLLAACTAVQASEPPGSVDAGRLAATLTLWPEGGRQVIAGAVARAAAQDNAPPFATFDADGTLWSSDALESFLAYLEGQGVLTPERVEPQLKVIPFLPGEGVYSYYQRLCAVDKAIGYPWGAQVLAGFSIAELRTHYARMMATTKGTEVTVWSREEGKPPSERKESVPTPRLFPQQAQLVHALESCGVRVYIVTASPEEIVRFLACEPACDPSFTLRLPPERVIGVNLLLAGSDGPTSSRLRLNKAAALFDAEHSRGRWEERTLTSFVLPPVPVFAGKVAAIANFIHPTQAPVLAAGDSGSDFPMLFRSSGARIWVDHPYTRPGTIDRAMTEFKGTPESVRGWVRGTWDMKGAR